MIYPVDSVIQPLNNWGQKNRNIQSGPEKQYSYKKKSVRDSASTSGHSLRSFAERLSNPVAFDLQSFDSSAIYLLCWCCFFKNKIFISSVRNSSKDLSTSVTSLLRLGPISVKKEFSISAIAV